MKRDAAFFEGSHVMKTAALAFVLMVAATLGQARAACSTDLRTHLSLGLSFLKDAQAYEARNEGELAAAEWENVGHQVEMIGGATSPEILSCDDPTLNREFYLIASWNEFKQILAATHDNPQVPPASARAFREFVAILYSFGGATYYRADYLTLKSDVREVDDLASIPYCSPEQSAKTCNAAQARCPVAEQAASLARTVDVDYPDWAMRFLNPIGGTYTSQVTVSLDVRGSVLSAVVSKSANTLPSGYDNSQMAQALAAIDDAVLKAAKASSYRPQIAHCRPVPSTVIFSSDFSADSQ
jgi:hypothetical protein